jgi:hypothetical protein
MRKLDWVLGLALAAQAVGAEPHLAMTVQVMNNANVPDPEVRMAETEAGLMFQRAGIEIHWLDCRPQTPGVAEPACKSIDEPMLFVLSITAGTAPNGSGTALGYALMQGHGNHAAALYPRVAELVKSHPEYANSTILGSVLAHELAHLVFHTTQHGEGVMRAKWDRGDYQAMAQRRLGFSKQQAEQLREMLARRMASAGAGTAPRALAGLR